MNVTLNNVNPGQTQQQPVTNSILPATTENLLLSNPNETFAGNPQFINTFPSTANQPILLLQQQQQQQQQQPVNNLTNIINFSVNEQELEAQTGSNLQFVNELKPTQNSQFQITSISRPQQITGATTTTTSNTTSASSNKENSKQESRFRIVKTDSERKTDSVSQSSSQPLPPPPNPTTNNLPSAVTNVGLANLPQQSPLVVSRAGGQQGVGGTLGTSYNRGRWKVVDYEPTASSNIAFEQQSSASSIQPLTHIKQNQINSTVPTIPENDQLKFGAFEQQQTASVNGVLINGAVQAPPLQQTHFNPIGSSTTVDANFYSTQTAQNFATPIIQPIVNKIQMTQTTTTLNMNPVASLSSSIASVKNTQSDMSSTSQASAKMPNPTSDVKTAQTFGNVDSATNENFAANTLLISTSAEQSNPNFISTTTTTTTTNPAVKALNSQVPLSTPANSYQTQQQQTLNVNISANTAQSQTGFNQTSPKDQTTKTAQPQQQAQMSNSASTTTTTTTTATSTSTGIIDPTTATIKELIGDTDFNSENEKKSAIDSDKGIKSRIELAMDLVKSHLTSAVNQEILFLKNQIKTLTEKCNRLEQDNQILRKSAHPDTLALLDNRCIPTGQTSSQQAATTSSSTSSSNTSITTSLSSSSQSTASAASSNQSLTSNNTTTTTNNTNNNNNNNLYSISDTLNNTNNANFSNSSLMQNNFDSINLINLNDTAQETHLMGGNFEMALKGTLGDSVSLSESASLLANPLVDAKSSLSSSSLQSLEK